ncbi:MAG: selenocysteine-specific translation elongation factor [Chitinivibrionia bacterium]|nr:selenocysteine-specific translation elongation factor [Chitinivibrionia bacterium]
MRRFILGTAGHVDHGKTALVKALTGKDTDRLKEEQERGISIELGFAPLRLDDDVFCGVVDVPGHERFIKNMVAGAGGIDIALLVVAADESVMPQTKEHLDVLQSLGISHGIIVITKIDCASEDLVEVVKSDIADLVAGTMLEKAEIVDTSVRTGAGLDALKRAIAAVCRDVEERDQSGPFRLPIDRVFIREGIGLVATGSCYSGSLALQGVKTGEVQRGDVLVTPSHFHVSHMIDARITLTAFEAVELKNRQRVRVHHGAREVLGRIVLLERELLASSESALVQLRLESPIVAGAGDHFVIRRYSPARVLGGGRVLDPNPAKHKQFDSAVIGHLSLLEKGDEGDIRMKAVFDAGFDGYDAGNLPEGMSQAMLSKEDVVSVEGILFHRRALDRLAERISELAGSYGREHPLLYGIDREELKQKLRFGRSKAVFNGVLDALSRSARVFIRGNRVRTGAPEPDVSPSLKRDIDGLEAFVKRAGVQFPLVEDLEKQWRGSSDFQDALQSLKEAGAIVKIADRGYIHAESLDQCVHRVRILFERTKELSVGDFKDEFNLTRKHAIPLLEYMDEHRITVRSGDARIKGPALHPEEKNA